MKQGYLAAPFAWKSPTCQLPNAMGGTTLSFSKVHFLVYHQPGGLDGASEHLSSQPQSLFWVRVCWSPAQKLRGLRCCLLNDRMESAFLSPRTPLSPSCLSNRRSLNIVCTFFPFSFFKSSSEDMFIDFWRERQRNTDVREKHRSAASHTHLDQESNPKPSYVPWRGIKPTTFRCMEWRSNRITQLGLYFFWQKITGFGGALFSCWDSPRQVGLGPASWGATSSPKRRPLWLETKDQKHLFCSRHCLLSCCFPAWISALTSLSLETLIMFCPDLTTQRKW